MHITTKTVKVKGKEKILKAAREKQLFICKGTPMRLSAGFLAETLQARMEWHDIFKVLKGNNFQHEFSSRQGYHSLCMHQKN